MYVNRRTFVARKGSADKMLATLNEIFDRQPWPGEVRVYRSRFGPDNHIVVEFECESLAAFEREWQIFHDGAFTEESGQAWTAMEDQGGRNEFWVIVDKRVSGP